MPSLTVRRGARLALALGTLAVGCGPTASTPQVGALPDRVDYNADVKPILSDRCFACHGPDTRARKADLRLDTPDGARAVVQSRLFGPAELVHRITTTDSSAMMPPRESGLALSAFDKAVLARWVEQGAAYKPHWSLIRPAAPAPSPTRDARWARTPIDRFVLARLVREGVMPNAEADRERLIRRVTYDLTGLPPAPDDVARFVADRAPNAYERVVDRLLASPAYGERMASEWMDVARYADSHGYQDDGERAMWPWRDWVISAFNRNQRYDEFVTWQLAGDLLPNATREQILATGFGRNHPISAEGGIIDEETRVEYVADRTNTFGRAFLGLTVECARCHDHKYDPITQREYYSLYAFFNSIHEIGTGPIDGHGGPVLPLPDDTTAARLAVARRDVADREAHARRYLADYQARLTADARALDAVRRAPPDLARGLVGHFPLDRFAEKRTPNVAPGAMRAPGQVDSGVAVAAGRFGGALEVREGQAVSVPKAYNFDRADPFTLSAWIRPTRHTTHAPVLTKAMESVRYFRGYDLALRDGRVTMMLVHSWPTDAIRVRTRAAVPLGAWTHLAATYDGSGRADGLRLYVNGAPVDVEVEADHLTRHTRVDEWVPFLIGRKNGTDQAAFEGGRVDEVRVYDRTLAAVEVAQLADSGAWNRLQNVPAEQLPAPQRASLAAFAAHASDRAWSTELVALRESRTRENALASAVPNVMVMQELPRPRPTFVLARGAYDAPGARVAPGTPKSVLAFPADLPPDRLGLARWLFRPDHPLTARVAVNRYWQMIWGRGLVETSDDFGSQGSFPSHPELLDHLAVQFRESGWDVKGLLRSIVTSSTYRQSSLATAAMRERDPGNALLARGPSHRLPAEMIRDGALAASGLLVHKLGGPSVRPYQPAGLWEEKSAGRGALATYVQGKGDDLYRRSLYTIWKRTSPPPQAMTFDAAERVVCTVRRQSTNTPLQSLVLMNDPQYVEAARLLAERMAREGGPGAEARIAWGFRAATARVPRPPEAAALHALYAAELAEYRSDRARALRLLRVGDRPRDPALDPAEVAALAVVANTLLNLDEAVTKR